MGFNPLLEELPTEWEGVPIKTDFRQPLRFFRCTKDRGLSPKEKAGIVIRLFFDPGQLPFVSTELWDFVLFFVSGGEPEKEDSGSKVFDFEIDAGRVFAAFWQTYGIDLTAEKMHWWVFLELFRALPDDTMLSKVMDIRGREIPKGIDPKQRYNLIRAKRAFALEQDDPHSLINWFKGL